MHEFILLKYLIDPNNLLIKKKTNIKTCIIIAVCVKSSILVKSISSSTFFIFFSLLLEFIM